MTDPGGEMVDCKIDKVSTFAWETEVFSRADFSPIAFLNNYIPPRFPYVKASNNIESLIRNINVAVSSLDDEKRVTLESLNLLWNDEGFPRDLESDGIRTCSEVPPVNICRSFSSNSNDRSYLLFMDFAAQFSILKHRRDECLSWQKLHSDLLKLKNLSHFRERLSNEDSTTECISDLTNDSNTISDIRDCFQLLESASFSLTSLVGVLKSLKGDSVLKTENIVVTDFYALFQGIWTTITRALEIGLKSSNSEMLSSCEYFYEKYIQIETGLNSRGIVSCQNMRPNFDELIPQILGPILMKRVDESVSSSGDGSGNELMAMVSFAEGVKERSHFLGTDQIVRTFRSLNNMGKSRWPYILSSKLSDLNPTGTLYAMLSNKKTDYSGSMYIVKTFVLTCKGLIALREILGYDKETWTSFVQSVPIKCTMEGFESLTGHFCSLYTSDSRDRYPEMDIICHTDGIPQELITRQDHFLANFISITAKITHITSSLRNLREGEEFFAFLWNWASGSFDSLLRRELVDHFRLLSKAVLAVECGICTPPPDIRTSNNQSRRSPRINCEHIYFVAEMGGGIYQEPDVDTGIEHQLSPYKCHSSQSFITVFHTSDSLVELNTYASFLRQIYLFCNEQSLVLAQSYDYFLGIKNSSGVDSYESTLGDIFLTKRKKRSGFSTADLIFSLMNTGDHILKVISDVYTVKSKIILDDWQIALKRVVEQSEKIPGGMNTVSSSGSTSDEIRALSKLFVHFFPILQREKGSDINFYGEMIRRVTTNTIDTIALILTDTGLIPKIIGDEALPCDESDHHPQLRKIPINVARDLKFMCKLIQSLISSTSGALLNEHLRKLKYFEQLCK